MSWDDSTNVGNTWSDLNTCNPIVISIPWTFIDSTTPWELTTGDDWDFYQEFNELVCNQFTDLDDEQTIWNDL